MTVANDWRKIEALFDAAWEMPAHARAAWLRGSGEPTVIIGEVERLLAAVRRVRGQ